MPNMTDGGREFAGCTTIASGHAQAILRGDFPQELEAIQRIIARCTNKSAARMTSGPMDAVIVGLLEDGLGDWGWVPKTASFVPFVDGVPQNPRTLQVPYLRGRVAVTLDVYEGCVNPDRAVSEFRVLFEGGAIDVGILVTWTGRERSSLSRDNRAPWVLEDPNWSRTVSLVGGGGAGACPLIVIGIIRPPAHTPSSPKK